MGKRKRRLMPQRISLATRAYSAMNESILTSISSGDLRIGDRLPSEAELRDQFGISVNSVRRGVDQLIEQGIVERRHGSGTFVKGRPVPKPPQEKDTIALLSDICFRTYHPYYTEMWKAVRSTLMRLGWKVWELPMPDSFYYDEDSSYLPHLNEKIGSALREHPEFAGCVASANLIELLTGYMAMNDALPFVVPGFRKDCHCVGYDWCEEFRHGILDVVEHGAREVLLVGNENTDFTGIVKGIRKTKVRFHQVKVSNDTCFSHSVNDSRIEVLKFLENHPDIDGFFADSDFVAQGVFDAISESGLANRRKIHCAALVNVTSQLFTGIPFNAFCADGIKVGACLAELLNECITSPETAARSIQLRTSTRRM